MRSFLSQITDYSVFLNEAWQQHLAPRMATAPTVISTFAGCGGSSLGYSMAGYKELLAVEWDNNAVQTFELNLPNIPVYHGDIAELSVDKCMGIAGLTEPGQLDVLDGSPPCQGFSTAGKRNFNDDRNQLFHEYVRLLRSLQPKVFVMENVSGMVKGKMKLIFAEILRELKASGYVVSARLLNAKWFGVPQSRERMIFIGIRKDLEISSSHPVANTSFITFKNAVIGLPEDRQIIDIDHIWVDEVSRNTKWIRKVQFLKAGEKLVLNKPSAIKLYWDQPVPTIQKNAFPGCPPYVRNSMIHPNAIRTLSIREMARCQSFPDGFKFINPLNEGMQRIGNSVPPLFMRAIALHIKDNILQRFQDATGIGPKLLNG